MRIVRSKKLLVVLVGLLVAGSVAAVAMSGVIESQVISDGTGKLHYSFQRRVTDGFDSGWHIHPGLVIVQVEEGSIQIYQGSCTPKTVGPGDTYIEVPYKPVRAIAKGKVTQTTTFLLNGGDPILIPQPGYDPCPGIG